MDEVERGETVRWGLRTIATVVLAAAGVVVACQEPPNLDLRSRVSASPARKSESKARPYRPRPIEPVRMEAVAVPNDLPAYVLRGARGKARMVFVHGLCGHALGYAQSFQFAAAKKGSLLAIQGDRPCNGPFRRWSGGVQSVHERIEAAFRAAGDTAPLRDIVLMGYSSGAVICELLAHRWPERYTRLVLIGSPSAPAQFHLRRVRGAVMMAAERDRHDLMKQGRRALAAANIPTTFMVLPDAAHGEMGPEAERVMGEALDWLWQHAPPATQSPAAPGPSGSPI